MAFSDEEVDAAVQQYLSTELAVGRTSSGSRTTTEIRDGALELLTTALLMSPGAWFYCIGLCSNRLTAELAEQLDDLADIVLAADRAYVQSPEVSSTAELVAAQAALLDLSTGVDARSNGINGSLGPGVERFRRAISRFITTELSSVISGTEILETGQEQRVAITALWRDMEPRHDIIVELAASIGAAIDNLNAVRLPERAAQGVVRRIRERVDALATTLGRPGSAQQNRTALLDLLAARSLLTKVSGFGSIRVDVMPRLGDPTTGTIQTSDGTEASVLGTVSSPYNYDGGATVDLTLNGAATTPSVVLPNDYGSRAVLYSQVLSFPGGPGVTAEAAVRNILEGTLSTFVTAGSPYSSGSVAATAIGGGLGPDIEVFWDSLSGRLAFVSSASSDNSLVEFDLSTADRVAFSDWAFGVAGTTRAEFVVVQAGDLIELFEASDPGLRCVVRETYYGNFSGARSNSFPNQILSPSTNFSAIPVGARVKLSGTSTNNSGYYRVLSGVVPGVLVLDRSIPDADSSLYLATFNRLIELSAVGTTTQSGIAALSTPGATALGLPVAAEVPASLTEFVITSGDFMLRGVLPGDLLELIAPSGAAYSVVVLTVAPRELMFDTAVPYEAGAWEYSVRNFNMVDYQVLQEACLEFDTSLVAVRVAVQQLIKGARFSPELVQAFSDYSVSLEDLATACAAYTPAVDDAMRHCIETFQEQGLDRALDLLLELRVSELFTMHPDGVSYSTWLVRASIDAAREVAPQSKFKQSAGVTDMTVKTMTLPNSSNPLGRSR